MNEISVELLKCAVNDVIMYLLQTCKTSIRKLKDRETELAEELMAAHEEIARLRQQLMGRPQPATTADHFSSSSAEQL